MNHKKLGLFMIILGLGITVLNYEQLPIISKACDTMTEKNYINSKYYNETHSSFGMAKSNCYDMASTGKLLAELIPFVGITCVGIVIFFLSLRKNSGMQKEKSKQ